MTARTARFFYTLALYFMLPYIFLRLLSRARKQPEYLQHWGERFGFYPQRSDKPLIWLHAVSVGETRATVSLVGKLRARYPDHQILLTHTTPTGRATSAQLYGDKVMRVYLPYDYPCAVRRFLRHFQPQLGVLMETEIWFNLVAASAKKNIPLLLLNARMSEKSARGYARFAQLTRAALQTLTCVAAQTQEDAARLTALGAKQVTLMGNLKFDIEPPVEMLELGKTLSQQFGIHRNVLLAASTREGEENLLLEAYAEQNCKELLLIIVPRHPQRFAEVADLLSKRNLRYQRRSENQMVADEIQVVLGDSMGEMFAYYAAADIAFIGGSVLPFGGQNLIEAAAVGTPVLIGPHTFNFAEATRLAIAARAAIRINDAPALFAAAQNLFNDAETLAAMRQQGLAFVATHQGATDKAMQIIEVQICNA